MKVLENLRWYTHTKVRTHCSSNNGNFRERDYERDPTHSMAQAIQDKEVSAVDGGCARVKALNAVVSFGRTGEAVEADAAL